MKIISLSVFLIFALIFAYVFIAPIIKWSSVSDDVSKKRPSGNFVTYVSENDQKPLYVSPENIHNLLKIINNSPGYIPAHEIYHNVGLVEFEGLIVEIKKKEDKILLSISKKSNPFEYLKRVQPAKAEFEKWLSLVMQGDEQKVN